MKVEKNEQGKLDAYAWPGGYPLYYLDRENSVLCADCALAALDDPEELSNFKPVACDIYYEGSDMECDSCGKRI